MKKKKQVEQFYSMLLDSTNRQKILIINQEISNTNIFLKNTAS